MTMIFAVDELIDIPIDGGRGTLLTALTDLDLATCHAARTELARAEARADKALVVDVSEVFVSVVALRVIVEALVVTTRRSIAFALVGAPHWMLKTVPHLDIPPLPVYNTVTAAVADVRRTWSSTTAGADRTTRTRAASRPK
jgi:hypothetical protein